MTCFVKIEKWDKFCKKFGSKNLIAIRLYTVSFSCKQIEWKYKGWKNDCACTDWCNMKISKIRIFLGGQPLIRLGISLRVFCGLCNRNLKRPNIISDHKYYDEFKYIDTVVRYTQKEELKITRLWIKKTRFRVRLIRMVSIFHDGQIDLTKVTATRRVVANRRNWCTI